jgi:predicted Zn-dependent peptidase
MTRRRFLIAGVIACLVALYLPPVAARQAAGTPQSITEFEVNGLKVLVKRRAGSQTVAGGLFIRGGSRNLTAANAGIEQLMLDVATEASENFPRERFRRELARTGTSIGSGGNYDYSAFTLACTRRYFDSAWTLFADAALRPSFAADDFDRVKNRDLVGLGGLDDRPDAFLQTLEAKVIYAGHPYANDPHGTVESLRTLTVADMKRFHEQVMQTSRLLLVLVGDLDPEEIKRKVGASFSALPRGSYAASAAPPLSFKAPTVSVTPKGLPTHYVQGMYAAPPLSSPDIYPMRVAVSILHDRVYAEVRLKRALSYAPDASLGSQGANVGGVYVTAVDANQAVRLMLGEIAGLRTTEVSADAIKGTVQQFLTNYYLGQETNAAQAGALAQAELIGGGWRTEGQFLERLRAVTPQDVRRVADTYMRNLQWVVVGNPQDIDQRIFVQSGG